MEQEYLSIVIPIYNVEKYLRECLESVYSLSFKKEIILVIDGSTDSSLSIAREFADKYVAETLLIIQQNKGLSGARNTGLMNATGKWICFLDSDDYINFHEMEKFYFSIIDQNVDILHGDGIKIESKKITTPVRRRKYIPSKKIMTGQEFVYSLYDQDVYLDYIWLNIYKREFLLNNKLYWKEDIRREEDIVHTIEAFWKAKKVQYNEIYFYYYRTDNYNSLSHSKIDYVQYLKMLHYFIDILLEEKIEHKKATRWVIARTRQVLRYGNLFDWDLYKKCWKLPQKKWNSYRNLCFIFIKSIFRREKNVSLHQCNKL